MSVCYLFSFSEEDNSFVLDEMFFAVDRHVVVDVSQAKQMICL
jgi:hypothetical protein